MSLLLTLAFGQVCITFGLFPEGPSQQCADDAGPPWADDVAGQPYYKTFPNAPVLPISGQCPAPIQDACASKGALAAHLDGPVNCGGKGWFCRISYQADHTAPGFPQWPNLPIPDSNFASCNQSDTEHDHDGHCHGSDVDDTYGWWIRDHWHRNYAGSLKCCCDWQATKGVVNRCDYRKHVAPEALDSCRDANEEHNVDWAPGCTAQDFANYKEPQEGQCWHVRYFGPARVGDNDNNDGNGNDNDNDEDGNNGTIHIGGASRLSMSLGFAAALLAISI